MQAVFQDGESGVFIYLPQKAACKENIVPVQVEVRAFGQKDIRLPTPVPKDLGQGVLPVAAENQRTTGADNGADRGEVFSMLYGFQASRGNMLDGPCMASN